MKPLTADQRARFITLLTAATVLGGVELQEAQLYAGIAAMSGELEGVRTEARGINPQSLNLSVESPVAVAIATQPAQPPTTPQAAAPTTPPAAPTTPPAAPATPPAAPQAGTPPAAPQAGTTTPPAAPQAAATPTFSDRALSLIRSRAGLQAQNATVANANGNLQAQLEALTTERDELKATLAAVTGERDGLGQLLNQAMTHQQTLGETMTLELGAVGVPQSQLPPAQSQADADKPTTKDELSTAADSAFAEGGFKASLKVLNNFEKEQAA